MTIVDCRLALLSLLYLNGNNWNFWQQCLLKSVKTTKDIFPYLQTKIPIIIKNYYRGFSLMQKTLVKFNIFN